MQRLLQWKNLQEEKRFFSQWATWIFLVNLCLKNQKSCYKNLRLSYHVDLLIYGIEFYCINVWNFNVFQNNSVPWKSHTFAAKKGTVTFHQLTYFLAVWCVLWTSNRPFHRHIWHVTGGKAQVQILNEWWLSSIWLLRFQLSGFYACWLSVMMSWLTWTLEYNRTISLLMLIGTPVLSLVWWVRTSVVKMPAVRTLKPQLVALW